jgi:hypothetical protein
MTWVITRAEIKSVASVFTGYMLVQKFQHKKREEQELFTTNHPHQNVSTLSAFGDFHLYLSACMTGTSFSSALAVGLIASWCGTN